MSTLANVVAARLVLWFGPLVVVAARTAYIVEMVKMRRLEAERWADCRLSELYQAGGR
jgi:hypothetical protein